jgi:cobyrinic acid a,c-diamide synthase
VEREAQAALALGALADALARYCDLDAIERLARAAAGSPGAAWDPAPPPAREPSAGSARIAIAAGPAFSFHYEENLELLSAAGAELIPFDPLTDESLPAQCGALVLAGGFPEVFGAELEANAPLRAEIAAFAATGRPVLAECGGLLYLAERLDGHELCGVLPLTASMTRRLSLGYRDAVAAAPTPWMAAGEHVRGHEFHYAEVEAGGVAPGGVAPRGVAPGGVAPGAVAPAWTLSARGAERPDGAVHAGVQAGFLHVHWAAFPELARRFAAAARAAVPSAA